MYYVNLKYNFMCIEVPDRLPVNYDLKSRSSCKYFYDSEFVNTYVFRLCLVVLFSGQGVPRYMSSFNMRFARS